jgi:PAS domain-containing protein
MPPIPTIATFPRADAAFARFVRTTIERLPAAERSDPAAVQRALRRWHTRALIRPQDPLASFGAATWYVYRDGQAGVRLEGDWWQEPDVAVARLGEDEVFVDGDDEACRLVGRPPGGLAGVPWRELVPSEVRDDDATWLFEGLQTGPAVQSVFDFPLPDGGRRVIEYRTAWVPEERIYLCRWRELAIIDGETVPKLVGDATRG